MGWFVIVGSIPVGVVGFAAQSLITGSLKSLWGVGQHWSRGAPSCCTQIGLPPSRATSPS